MDIYINKVLDAKITSNQISQYIDSLNILPDFLDPRWPSNKKYIEEEFIKKTNIPDGTLHSNISVDRFLKGEKRDLYINVLKPTTRLFVV